MSFDAGSIESQLTLDRDPFQRGLAEADRQAREFSSMRIAPVIDLDTERFKRRVLDVDEQVRRLSAEDARIAVHLDTSEATAQILRLKAEIDSIHGKTVRVGANGGGAGSGSGFLAGGISGPSNLLTAAAAGIPTLIPIVATLTAGIGGLVSVFGAAGIGAAGFGLIAKSVLGDVLDKQKALTQAQAAYEKATTNDARAKALQQEKTILDSLTPVQRQFLSEVTQLQGAWKGLQAAISPEVFQAATFAISGLVAGAKLVEPVLRAAGYAAVVLAGQFNTWVQHSQGLRDFLDFLAKETGPAIVAVGHSIGNVFAGLGGIMMAFQPMLHGVEDGLVHVTGAFANWGKGLGGSTGFQAFMDYVREHGPEVGKMFGELAKAIGTIVTQLAPFGPVGLRLVTMLAQLINQHPGLVNVATALILVWKSVSLLSGAAGGITKTVQGFAGLAKVAPMLASIAIAAGPVIIAIGGLALAGYELYTHWHQVIGFIERDWKYLLLLIPGLGPVIFAVARYWDTMWDSMSSATSRAWGAIRGAVSAGTGYVMTAVNFAVHATQSVWNSTWNAVAGATGYAWAVIRGVVSSGVGAVVAAAHGVSAVTGIIDGAFVAAYNGVAFAIGAIVNEVKGIGGQILLAIGNLGSALYNAGKSIVVSIARGIRDAAGDAWNAISGVAGGIRSHLPFSPAKVGPLSGLGSPDIAGAKIVQMIANGMIGNLGVLDSAAAVVAGRTLQMGTLSGGGMAGRPNTAPSPIGKSTSVTQNFIYRGPLTPQVVSESRRQLDFALGS